LPNQANLPPSWKQEVNQRVAAHKDRKTVSSAEPGEQAETHSIASSKAAAAAARVAARYAKAPSYSEILAGEARAAVRAAEAASKAALEAQAAAESVLAGLEAASASGPDWEFHTPEAETRLAGNETETGQSESYPSGLKSESEAFEIRWEPDLPARPAEIAPVRATVGAEIPEKALEPWREPEWPAQDGPGAELITAVEPAEPIHANLIEFPREIIATRKVRPRLLEGPLGASGGQLSIFEVDPSSISTEPLMAGAVAGASAPAWTGPEWSGIELGAQPRPEFLERAPEEPLDVTPPLPERAAGTAGAQMLAPLSLRLMAAVVNTSLAAGAFLVVALMTASRMTALPGTRVVEVVAALGFVVVAVLYHALFFTFAKGTPGMSYAGISLCTFDGKRPTRAQRFGRLGAMLLSVLPVGLGVMWAVFDEDHLSWHDRLSRTYLRKN
jgi:uncharacterized RDD family membrane protein YckC